MVEDNTFRGLVRDNAIEFCLTPCSYAARTIEHIVEDYWDIGLAATGGFLMSPAAEYMDIFGQYDFQTGFYLYLFGAIGGVFERNVAAAGNRVSRNVIGGAAAILAGAGNLPSYVYSATAAITAWLSEMYRREEISTAKRIT